MKTCSDFIDELYLRTQIAPNIDLDGMLTSVLITKYFPHLKVKGYTDSKTNIWLEPDAKTDQLIYLDCYIKKPEVCCIDQHIIDVDDINDEPLKFNPNRLFNKSLKNYTSKYPLSTFIFTLWILESNGINVDIDLQTKIDDNLYLWELVLRADGVLMCFADYTKNMTTWWNCLLPYVDENSLTRQIFNLMNMNHGETYAKQFQKEVEKKLKMKYNAHKDGFDNLSPGFFNLLTKIHQALNVPINFTTDTSKLNNYQFLRPQIESNNPVVFKKLMNDTRVTAYAFVRRNNMSIQIHPKYAGLINEHQSICKGYDKGNEFVMLKN